MEGLIGYVRVSKNDGSQLLDLQLDALQKEGVSSKRIYEDFASGKKEDRPGLEACLKALQPGNTLVVWKLDRLGRNLVHLNQIINYLNDNRIALKVLDSTMGRIDTTTPSGKLMFNLFSVLAEYERDLIRERTMAGLKAARARGRCGGRPQKMTKPILKVIASEMKDRSVCVKDLCKQYNIGYTCLYNYVTPSGDYTEKGLSLLNKE